MPGPNEERTRIERIDPALLRAGWDVTDSDEVGIEIPVDGYDPQVWAVVKPQLDELFAAGAITSRDLPIGISDYVLKRANGEVLAVVEAKRTSVDPRIAQTQTEFYMAEIAKRQSFKPFGFMTNGYEIYFLDPQHPAKRTVRGFFNRADLENRLFLQQHRQPLGSIPINKGIVDRSYQHEAIRRIGEAFDKNKRRALLVMATGTGKTRTTMALIDVLLKANQARNILFVADRDALVTQALTDGFKKFLPDEPCDRIHTTNITTSSRLYTATLQTISMCFSQFSPGFFDVMIFDEVHRSIFSQWREVLDYFDARIVGLTADPGQFYWPGYFSDFPM